MKNIALALLLMTGTAFAGITGTDPRPPRTTIVIQVGGMQFILNFGPGGGIPSPIGQQ